MQLHLQSSSHTFTLSRNLMLLGLISKNLSKIQSDVGVEWVWVRTELSCVLMATSPLELEMNCYCFQASRHWTNKRLNSCLGNKYTNQLLLTNCNGSILRIHIFTAKILTLRTCLHCIQRPKRRKIEHYIFALLLLLASVQHSTENTYWLLHLYSEYPLYYGEVFFDMYIDKRGFINKHRVLWCQRGKEILNLASTSLLVSSKKKKTQN